MNMDLRLKVVISTLLYLGIILMIVTDFDLIIFPVTMVVVFVISYIRFNRRVKLKNKVKKSKEHFMKTKESFDSLEVDEKFKADLDYFNGLEKKIDLMIEEVDEDYVLEKIRVDNAVLIRPDIIQETKAQINKNLEENFDILIDILNYEEIKLVQFLHLRRLLSYNYFIGLEVFILSTAIILALLSYFISFSLFFLWFSLFFLFYRDIQHIMERIFKNGYLRYKIVKKKLAYYQNQLKFIFNNSQIRHKIDEFDTINDKDSLFKKKLGDYLDALPPYYSYIKKIELIGVVGIILSVIFFVFQGYVNLFPDFVKLDLFDFFYSFAFIYAILISPALRKQREYKEKQVFKEVYNKIDKNFIKIRKLQIFLITHETNFF